MNVLQFDGATMTWLIPVLIWELLWKGLALWRAGRNNQPKWFAAILIINTFGLLPIVYLLYFSKKTTK